VVELRKCHSLYAVATSESPVGPFKLRVNAVNVTRGDGGGGDFDLFVDDDGAGYVVYSSLYWMSVEKLTPDFLYSTGQNASCGPKGSPLFPEYFVEAPVFFKRNSIYYILFGHCCCFCEQGSGVIVHTATSPLGVWQIQAGEDVACRSSQFASEFPLLEGVEMGVRALPTPGQGCLYQSDEMSVTRSQQNFIVQVEVAGGEVEYVWTGDRWQQAPDLIKGHEPQFWVPLKFSADGAIGKMSWTDQFVLDIAVGGFSKL